MIPGYTQKDHFGNLKKPLDKNKSFDLSQKIVILNLDKIRDYPIIRNNLDQMSSQDDMKIARRLYSNI